LAVVRHCVCRQCDCTGLRGSLYHAAVNEYKGIDIIVNNAGYTWDNVIRNERRAVVRHHRFHLTAPFRILRAAQP